MSDQHIGLIAAICSSTILPILALMWWYSMKLKSMPIPELKDTPELREAIQAYVSVLRIILIARMKQNKNITTSPDPQE